MTKLRFVLGASDPEMAAIETLLRERGESYTLATINGRRVFPANAYHADPVLAPPGYRLVAVECGWNGGDRPARSCDHHRPGDAGYGKPPSGFWTASSLGQVCTLLGVKPTENYRMLAAADHCLAAAYRGQCPGVEPDLLMRWRASSRAHFQRRPISAVLADIEAAIEAISLAPMVCVVCGSVNGLRACCGSHSVHDLRSRGTVPEAPEAAARAGLAFLARVSDRDGGRKEVLQGASPETIAAYIASHAGAYGDPARGFAGFPLVSQKVRR